MNLLWSRHRTQDKTDMRPHRQETNLRLLKGKGGIEVFATNIQATTYKIENQQGPTIQRREFCSIFCNNLYEKRI